MNKKIRTLGLSKSLGIIKKINQSLESRNENYQNIFIKRVEVVSSIFTKNGEHSELWNREMFYSIGTIMEEVPEKLRFKIALSRNPIFLEYICHTMLGTLVLNKKLTCCIGSETTDTPELYSIIEKTASEIGLKTSFNLVKKEFRDVPYQDRYVTFELK